MRRTPDPDDRRSVLVTVTEAGQEWVTGFLGIVTGVDMISELYGEGEATLVYDVHTATPVGTQRTAEHFRLRDGGIASIRLIFDATAWRPIMR